MLAVIVALVLVLTPWTVRNAQAFHAFVPISTQDGFTLVGQYNPDSGRDDQLQAVSRLPTQIPSLHPVLLHLFVSNHGDFNEAQLDSTLRHAALSYFRHHPSQLPITIWLSTLRMLDLGVNHEFTTHIAYREMGLPQALREPTTLTAQLIVAITLLGLLARTIGLLRFPVGPWWIWALPILAIASTVPVVGNPRYRTPADPFLILLATIALTAAIDRRTTRTGQQ